MKKISVIIPMYNVLKYFETCVLSLLDQEIEENDNIIIFNDGSHDDSAEVAKRLALKIQL